MTHPPLALRLLLPVLALFFTTGCDKKSETGGGPPKVSAPVPVNVGEALKKDMPLDLRAIGNVESIATVEIKAQVSGELIEVGFKEGQDVKKGDLLFSLQPKLYATQLAQADANLARDRATAANAVHEVKRSTDLAAKGAVSKEILDKLHANADAAAATVQADEALREIARVQLTFATIRAPMDGRTGTLAVQPGTIIKAQADTPMTTIKQLAPIYVTFAVPESDLSAIRRGLAARELPVTALDPQTEAPLGTGRVSFIANSVDMSTGTITLKATFPNADDALWPGAFVDVILHLDKELGVTVVPSSAVTNGQRGAQIFVIKDDATADLRSVVTGRVVGRETIINAGVRPGEQVVTNGQLRLAPGSKVLAKPALGTPAPGTPAPGTPAPGSPSAAGKPAGTHPTGAPKP